MTETTDTNKEEVKVRTTTTGDRCDSCNAEAFVWVNGMSGELYFCGHHFNKHEAKIREYAFEIIDDREFINVKPSMAAN
jgi:hypothetical protein